MAVSHLLPPLGTRSHVRGYSRMREREFGQLHSKFVGLAAARMSGADAVVRLIFTGNVLQLLLLGQWKGGSESNL